jgi:hypothetical protein
MLKSPERKLGNMENELSKRIKEISSQVYDVDENEPDPIAIAIEEDITKLVSDIQQSSALTKEKIIEEVKQSILKMDYNQLASGFLSVRAIILMLEEIK